MEEFKERCEGSQRGVRVHKIWEFKELEDLKKGMSFLREMEI